MRSMLEIKKNTSNNLVLVLLINKPINKESPIDDKLWDKEITIAQIIPTEFKDSIEQKLKFKCNIGDNAIIFFKSKYLKYEQLIINIPIKLI